MLTTRSHRHTLSLRVPAAHGLLSDATGLSLPYWVHVRAACKLSVLMTAETITMTTTTTTILMMQPLPPCNDNDDNDDCDRGGLWWCKWWWRWERRWGCGHLLCHGHLGHSLARPLVTHEVESSANGQLDCTLCWTVIPVSHTHIYSISHQSPVSHTQH